MAEEEGGLKTKQHTRQDQHLRGHDRKIYFGKWDEKCAQEFFLVTFNLCIQMKKQYTTNTKISYKIMINLTMYMFLHTIWTQI